jgi:hypothetical protein
VTSKRRHLPSSRRLTLLQRSQAQLQLIDPVPRNSQLLRREVNPADRRRRQLHLTEQGSVNDNPAAAP